MSTRDLEPGIVTDLADRLSYGGYLRLDHLLAAQARARGTGSVSSASSSLGLNASHCRGDERPVPRWSIRTTSRVLRTSFKRATNGASVDAA